MEHTSIPDHYSIENGIKWALKKVEQTGHEMFFEFRGAFLNLAPGDDLVTVLNQFLPQQFDPMSRVYKEQFLEPNKEFYDMVGHRLAQEARGADSLKVFDIGAGTGFVLDQIQNVCGKIEYTGLDVSPNMLEVLANKHKDSSIPVKTHAMCAHDFFAGDHHSGETFDVVSCVAAFHIIDKKGRKPGDIFGERALDVARSALQLLKSGGKFIVGNYYHARDGGEETFFKNWHNYQIEKGFKVIHQPTPGAFLFDPEHFKRFCVAEGLRVLEPIEKTQTALGIRGYILVAQKS